MKLRPAIINITLVVGASDGEQLSLVLADKSFLYMLGNLMSLYKLQLVGEPSINGIMSEGTITIEEPKIIIPS